MSADDVTSSQLLQAVELIEQLKEPVVVHCWHGSDRTGAVVAAYRILKQGWSKEQAISEMVNGGYGFHLIYWDIVEVLQQLPES